MVWMAYCTAVPISDVNPAAGAFQKDRRFEDLSLRANKVIDTTTEW